MFDKTKSKILGCMTNSVTSKVASSTSVLLNSFYDYLVDMYHIDNDIDTRKQVYSDILMRIKR